MIFIDGIAMTRRFDRDVPVIVGARSIRYREAGDVGRDGQRVEVTEVIGEKLQSAWIQGSHDTRIQMKSDGRSLTMIGNPGRYGRADNLFNLDLDGTVKAANRIAVQQGFPFNAFHSGHKVEATASELAADLAEGRQPEQRWSGARVWTLHATENYATGSMDNARSCLDWANTQTVARVKKGRLGASTLTWGSIRYCQTELYIKADEMLDHCKTKEEKAAMRESPAYLYAVEKGIIRAEVKCAYDFLRERQLTYLGNWDMGKVEAIFRERTEVLSRCKVDVEDDSWLEGLPRSSRVHALAWLAGVDVSANMSRATFYRHAAILREFGIDIAEKRNVRVMTPKLRTLELHVAEPPSWYSMAAA